MTKDEMQKLGGDNFTRAMSFLVLNFQDVNVGTRTENLWTLTADGSNADEHALAGLTLLSEFESHAEIVGGQVRVIGKN